MIDTASLIGIAQRLMTFGRLRSFAENGLVAWRAKCSTAGIAHRLGPSGIDVNISRRSEIFLGSDDLPLKVAAGTIAFKERYYSEYERSLQ